MLCVSRSRRLTQISLKLRSQRQCISLALGHPVCLGSSAAETTICSHFKRVETSADQRSCHPTSEGPCAVACMSHGLGSAIRELAKPPERGVTAPIEQRSNAAQRGAWLPGAAVDQTGSLLLQLKFCADLQQTAALLQNLSTLQQLGLSRTVRYIGRTVEALGPTSIWWVQSRGCLPSAVLLAICWVVCCYSCSATLQSCTFA